MSWTLPGWSPAAAGCAAGGCCGQGCSCAARSWFSDAGWHQVKKWHLLLTLGREARLAGLQQQAARLPSCHISFVNTQGWGLC